MDIGILHMIVPTVVGDSETVICGVDFRINDEIGPTVVQAAGTVIGGVNF